MDPKDPTPAADNPTDVVADAPVDPAAAGDGTGANADDPTNPSKSTDPSAADGDKKPPVSDDGAAGTPATFDPDLDQWIEKRGLTKPDTDEQKQAYQDLRNGQREFTREQQAKKDADALGKTVTDVTKDLKKTDPDDDEDDPLAKKVADLEAANTAERNVRLQSEFYTTQQVTPEEHKLILDIFKEKVDTQPTDDAKLKAVDLWGSPTMLPDLLDIARARLAKSTDTSDVEDKAAREERERIARESNAKSPGRNASTTTTSDKTEDEARLERFRDRFKSK